MRLFGDEIGRFQVIGPLQPILDENLRTLAPLALASILSLLVGGALVALALYRGLTPLQELAGTARALDARDLSTRVREPERLDEVGVLAREFNSMLERLEREAESRRGFLAAASHELRTPITIARATSRYWSDRPAGIREPPWRLRAWCAKSCSGSAGWWTTCWRSPVRRARISWCHGPSTWGASSRTCACG